MNKSKYVCRKCFFQCELQIYTHFAKPYLVCPRGNENFVWFLQEQSNTQMQPDKTPKCPICDWSKENKIYDKYCGACGRAFDR